MQLTLVSPRRIRLCTVDFPNRHAIKKASAAGGDTAQLKGWIRGASLAATESLAKESIKGVTQSDAARIVPREDPAVDWAVWVSDIGNAFGTELEHEQMLAVEAKDLRAGVFEGISV